MSLWTNRIWIILSRDQICAQLAAFHTARFSCRSALRKPRKSCPLLPYALQRPSLLKARRQQTFHASMPLVMVVARAFSMTISSRSKSSDALYLQMACTAKELSDSRKKRSEKSSPHITANHCGKTVSTKTAKIVTCDDRCTRHVAPAPRDRSSEVPRKRCRSRFIHRSFPLPNHSLAPHAIFPQFLSYDTASARLQVQAATASFQCQVSRSGPWDRRAITTLTG